MKLAALAPFPFHAGQFGGAERIRNLLCRVENEIDVFIPTLQEMPDEKFYNLNLHYGVVSQEVLSQHEWDIAVSYEAKQLFADKIADLNPDLVILEHPWQYEAVGEHKFLYDAHNNETRMKEKISPKSVDRTKKLETLSLEADCVTYCSELDELESNSQMVHIPNGTDIPELRERQDGYHSKMLLFVGSGHPPNVSAALTLAQLAPMLPDYDIVIAGSCGDYIKEAEANVKILGHVNDDNLDLLFRSAHAFVNLVGFGSGTSLKVPRALAYGLPVLSSEFGARGHTDSCIIAPNAESLFEELKDLELPKNYHRVSKQAREASLQFDWNQIGEKFNKTIEELV